MSNSKADNMSKFDKYSLATTLFSAAVVLFAAMLGSYLGFHFSEKETHSELKLVSANYQISYYLSNNNNTENLKLMPIIVVYNAKSSNYPAALFPVKYKIIDDETKEVIDDPLGGLEQPVALPGEDVTYRDGISMPLNKTGNYTLQATLYYLDVESDVRKSLEFYFEFHIDRNNGYDKESYPYDYVLSDYNPLEKQWKMGRKYSSI